MRFVYRDGLVFDLYCQSETRVGDVYEFMSTDDDYIMIRPDGEVLINNVSVTNIGNFYEVDIRQNDRYFTIFKTELEGSTQPREKTPPPATGGLVFRYFAPTYTGYLIDIPAMSVLKIYEGIHRHIFALPGDRVIVDSNIYDINSDERVKRLFDVVYNTHGNNFYGLRTYAHSRSEFMTWADASGNQPSTVGNIDYYETCIEVYPHGDILLAETDRLDIYHKGLYVIGFNNVDPKRYARIDETHIFLDELIIDLSSGKWRGLSNVTSFAADSGYLVIRDERRGSYWLFNDVLDIKNKANYERLKGLSGEILALHDDTILTTDGFFKFSTSETK